MIDPNKPCFVFQTPGELDMMAVTTMGVNAKTSDSAIGFFGTGLKYAIAVVLRLGGAVQIITDGKTYDFSTFTREVRGKAFQFICMESASHRQTLGFTTDLGKHWEPWMAYRELYSNTLDERGNTFVLASYKEPEFAAFRKAYAGSTYIIVQCDAIYEHRDAISKYFINYVDTDPLDVTDTVELHTKRDANQLFYKGIYAGSFGRLSLFSYNILAAQKLTEDRTFAEIWDVKCLLGQQLPTLTNKDVITKLLIATASYFEHDIDYNWPSTVPSEEFTTVTLDLVRTRKLNNFSARKLVFRVHPQRAINADDAAIADTWEDIVACAPETVPPFVAGGHGIYSYIHELENKIRAVQKAELYWRRVAAKLADKEVPTSDNKNNEDEDRVPF